MLVLKTKGAGHPATASLDDTDLEFWHKPQHLFDGGHYVGARPSTAGTGTHLVFAYQKLLD